MFAGNLGIRVRGMDRRKPKENEKVVGSTDDIGPVRSLFIILRKLEGQEIRGCLKLNL